MLVIDEWLRDDAAWRENNLKGLGRSASLSIRVSQQRRPLKSPLRHSIASQVEHDSRTQ